MKIIGLVAALALFAVATACTAERALSPQPSAPSFATTLTGAPPQVPLLFVVDGVKYKRDQVPSLTEDQILEVRVMKGRAALKEYGPDASYGVVVITTKLAATPRS